MHHCQMIRLSWMRPARGHRPDSTTGQGCRYRPTGPDGLLKVLTAQIVEAALDEELNEHLGYNLTWLI